VGSVVFRDGDEDAGARGAAGGLEDGDRRVLDEGFAVRIDESLAGQVLELDLFQGGEGHHGHGLDERVGVGQGRRARGSSVSLSE